MVEVTVPHIATKHRIRSSKLISPLHTLQRNPERLYRSAVFQFIAANTRPSPTARTSRPHPTGRRSCRCLFSINPNKILVISTEDAHSLTVSSEVEKSASLPNLHLTETPPVALAVAFAVAKSCCHPHPELVEPERT